MNSMFLKATELSEVLEVESNSSNKTVFLEDNNNNKNPNNIPYYILHLTIIWYLDCCQNTE